LDQVVAFLSTLGRMKYVRPLYRNLYATDFGRDIALKTFSENKDYYHPVCAGMLTKDLHLNEKK
jgi:leukotriene-A4 hydrolase